MFSPQHSGLFFDNNRIAYVRKNHKREPLQSAWDYLLSASPEGQLEKAQISALRYRFNADLNAGQEAATALSAIAMPSDPHDLLVLAQVYELTRDHTAAPGSFLGDFRRTIAQLPTIEDSVDLVDQVWLMVIYAAAGIMLEDATLFDQATAFFQHLVREEVHPEGYLPKAVELHPEEVSLERQLEVCEAFVLTAQMAEIAGVNLWHFEHRSVSILTATSYPLYYFFYPEKWPWNEEKWKPSEGIQLERVEQIFRRHSGFLEIVNLKYERPLKAINLILEQMRPIYDLYGGGLTTLTHAPSAKRGLFG